jgi:hypothetical protein
VGVDPRAGPSGRQNLESELDCALAEEVEEVAAISSCELDVVVVVVQLDAVVGELA